MAGRDVTPMQNSLDEKADFVDYFRQGFAKGSRDAFLNHFLPRIQPDATYRQPLSRGGSGHAGFRRLFTCMFAVVPDLHGTLHRWGPTEGGVFIEFTLGGTLGRGQVAVNVVDRIVLHDGCIVSNDTYFDSVPLLPRMLAHPILALRLLPRFFVSQIERVH
jgi:hypothetical protein